jgi:AcrR family transcriptional regulator
VAGTGKDGAGEERLGRLPPGRHGLSRDFVTRNQRERLIAGTIAAVSEHGYRDATIGRIAAAAGVSRQTFYDYFSTKEECYLASYQLLETHTLIAIGEAGEAERGWAGKVTRRIDALLEVLAGNPDLVRFSLVAPSAAGEEILARERTFLENLVGTLTHGAPKSTTHHPSGIELEALAGGLASLLAGRAKAGDDPELEVLRPGLVELVLAPFLGHPQAAAAAQKD